MSPWQQNPRDSVQPQREPPDYRSRSARLRIFVMVAGFMTVLVAMNEARKPENWQWIGKRTKREPLREPIDTRVPLNPAPSDPLPDSRDNRSHDSADSAQDQNVRGWSSVWDALSYHEKGELFRLLRLARRGDNPTSRETSSFELLNSTLDEKWNDYLRDQNRDALLPERELPDERRRALLQSLTDLEMMWNSRWKPALAGSATGWTAEARTSLAELEKMLDAIALARVRDDTVWRPDDGAAWFRLFEQLQDTAPEEIARQSVGHVSFVQIYRQSAEYRGKVVTVRGTARMVYRVPAPANHLGVPEYFLFWVQPEDGSNRPIVVYALNPPAGFPPITSEQQQVQEQVEVTGYFFKRWAYRAADGLNSAPLVIARSPQWSPGPPPAATPSQHLAETLGANFWWLAAAAIAGMLLLAIGLVWLINWSNRPSPVLSNIRAAAEAAANEADIWKSLPATPSIDEGLSNLEQTHRKEER